MRRSIPIVEHRDSDVTVAGSMVDGGGLVNGTAGITQGNELPNVSNKFPYFFPIKKPRLVKTVAQRAIELGVPIQQHYNFEEDSTVPTVDIHLKSKVQIRSYQRKALDNIFGLGTCRSGVVVLPCGSGKTLVGVAATCRIQKPTIVVCTSTVSVEQWKAQFLEFSVVGGQKQRKGKKRSHDDECYDDAENGGNSSACDVIAMITSKQKDKITAETGVVITTYAMVACAGRRVQRQARESTSTVVSGRTDKMAKILGMTWGLLILDEAHVVPAEFFKQALSELTAKATLGLTATPVREDGRITHLHYLVGPKLYESTTGFFGSNAMYRIPLRNDANIFFRVFACEKSSSFTMYHCCS